MRGANLVYDQVTPPRCPYMVMWVVLNGRLSLFKVEIERLLTRSLTERNFSDLASSKCLKVLSKLIIEGLN